MPRRSNVPKLGEAQEFYLGLKEDIAVDLHIYCEVLAAQKTVIINRAVRELIEQKLRENAGFQLEFREMKSHFIEEQRREQRRGKAEKIHVLKPREGQVTRTGRHRTKHPANSETD
jgi:hypothetical protein